VRDVQQHDTVDHVRRRDAAYGAGAVRIRHHEDVVAALASRRRDGEDVLQHRRRELVVVELEQQADDHRLGGRERTGARIHGEAEFSDRLVDSVAGLARDRSLARQRVRHGAAGDARYPCHIADGRHRSSSLVDRFAVEPLRRM
jgi:hypothetical protein